MLQLSTDIESKVPGATQILIYDVRWQLYEKSKVFRHIGNSAFDEVLCHLGCRSKLTKNALPPKTVLQLGIENCCLSADLSDQGG